MLKAAHVRVSPDRVDANFDGKPQTRPLPRTLTAADAARHIHCRNCTSPAGLSSTASRPVALLPSGSAADDRDRVAASRTNSASTELVFLRQASLRDSLTQICARFGRETEIVRAKDNVSDYSGA